MSCSNCDWKAYALGELDQNSRRQAEAHAATCSSCREELAGLRLTLDAMSTLREEEIPKRIAFVSDKVFEPRWYQMFLRPSFAAAGVLAAAILVHAFARPSLDQQALQTQIETAVNKAVADTEDRHTQQLREVLANYEMLQKQNNLMYIRTTGVSHQ
jgi:anti-sigma factor RsiW